MSGGRNVEASLKRLAPCSKKSVDECVPQSTYFSKDQEKGGGEKKAYKMNLSLAWSP